MINGMVYTSRTGISWRDLPERYGPWKTVCTRFRRYALDGILTRGPAARCRARADAAGDIDNRHLLRSSGVSRIIPTLGKVRSKTDPGQQGNRGSLP